MQMALQRISARRLTEIVLAQSLGKANLGMMGEYVWLLLFIGFVCKLLGIFFTKYHFLLQKFLTHFCLSKKMLGIYCGAMTLFDAFGDHPIVTELGSALTF